MPFAKPGRDLQWVCQKACCVDSKDRERRAPADAAAMSILKNASVHFGDQSRVVLIGPLDCRANAGCSMQLLYVNGKDYDVACWIVLSCLVQNLACDQWS